MYELTRQFLCTDCNKKNVERKLDDNQYNCLSARHLLYSNLDFVMKRRLKMSDRHLDELTLALI